ncbi:hypothetical protein H632_c177p1, partial [Helicosporidium sp. ATCC 50920]
MRAICKTTLELSALLTIFRRPGFPPHQLSSKDGSAPPAPCLYTLPSIQFLESLLDDIDLTQSAQGAPPPEPPLSLPLDSIDVVVEPIAGRIPSITNPHCLTLASGATLGSLALPAAGPYAPVPNPQTFVPGAAPPQSGASSHNSSLNYFAEGHGSGAQHHAAHSALSAPPIVFVPTAAGNGASSQGGHPAEGMQFACPETSLAASASGYHPSASGYHPSASGYHPSASTQTYSFAPRASLDGSQASVDPSLAYPGLPSHLPLRADGLPSYAHATAYPGSHAHGLHSH